MDDLTILFLWVVLSIAVGVYSDRKGHGLLKGFLLGMLLSPFLGLIFVAVMRENRNKQAEANKEKKCPTCAEWVKGEALKCRFCSHEFQAPAEPVREGSLFS